MVAVLPKEYYHETLFSPFCYQPASGIVACTPLALSSPFTVQMKGVYSVVSEAIRRAKLLSVLPTSDSSKTHYSVFSQMHDKSAVEALHASYSQSLATLTVVGFGAASIEEWLIYTAIVFLVILGIIVNLRILGGIEKDLVHNTFCKCNAFYHLPMLIKDLHPC